MCTNCVSYKNILLILHPDPSLSEPGIKLKLVVNNRMKASHFPYTRVLYNKVFYVYQHTQCDGRVVSVPSELWLDMKEHAFESRSIPTRSFHHFRDVGYKTCLHHAFFSSPLSIKSPLSPQSCKDPSVVFKKGCLIDSWRKSWKMRTLLRKVPFKFKQLHIHA